jgi:hypothetical protein
LPEPSHQRRSETGAGHCADHRHPPG